MIVGYKHLGVFALYVGLFLLVVVQQRQVGSSAYRNQYTSVRDQIFGFVDGATGLPVCASSEWSCLFLRPADIF